MKPRTPLVSHLCARPGDNRTICGRRITDPGVALTWTRFSMPCHFDKLVRCVPCFTMAGQEIMLEPFHGPAVPPWPIEYPGMMS